MSAFHTIPASEIQVSDQIRIARRRVNVIGIEEGGKPVGSNGEIVPMVRVIYRPMGDEATCRKMFRPDELVRRFDHAITA